MSLLREEFCYTRRNDREVSGTHASGVLGRGSTPEECVHNY